MNISVYGKQLDVGEALRSHVSAELEAGVLKYFGRLLDATVTISRAAHGFRADCWVHVGSGMKLQSHGEANDPYASFDVAVERLTKRLRRYKRRLRNHHYESGERQPTARTVPHYVLAPEAEDTAESLGFQPLIIAEATTEIPTATVGEAVMRMDLADLSALMFHNSAHGELNVVYRRADGNIGWIDPSGQARSGQARSGQALAENDDDRPKDR